ncbi:hypothetical protein POM88_043342 [Heracleum sosnowskyi]|uniref:Uncharacterized protein n=1 Tax=Heracleum sosnowskyi TaxID=360622 RepID=A0AAD8H293_9APIA|nr:hypothetical protein POM88_043342 [Heracleum sosnowskyi]
MLARSCLLRRLMVARRRVMMSFDSNLSYIQTTPPSFSRRHLQFSTIRGLNHPTCMFYHSKREDECDSEKLNIIKQGDVVDVSELLFSKHRDYLIRYNDPNPVTAEQLAGKFIVIYFLPFHYHVDIHPPDRIFKESLIDIYNDLKFKNCFEVVMVVDETYGSEAYPFDEERIAILKAKDKMAFSQHSLKELLGSSQRDFVISNKGEEIPIQTLEDKVEGERVKALKLEMLCSPNTVFKSKDGSQVQFSELAGKRIIFLFEGDYPEYDGENF